MRFTLVYVLPLVALLSLSSQLFVEASRRRAMSPRRRMPDVSPRRRGGDAPSSALHRRRSLAPPRRRSISQLRRRNPSEIWSNPANDFTRRRADMRRRSSEGWSVDTSRRRGWSGTSVAAAAGLGFLGGVATGALVGHLGQNYYYHAQGWTDSAGIFHNAGWYNSAGYYYDNPQQFGFTPSAGQPGYAATRSGVSSLMTLVVGVVVSITCCCCCCALLWAGGCFAVFQGRGDDDKSPSEDVEVADSGPGCPVVSTDDARGFLAAATDEYCRGGTGHVGTWMEHAGLNERDAQVFEAIEEQIRSSGDPRVEIENLRCNWGI